MVHESLKKLASIAKVPEELLGVGARTAPIIPVRRSISYGKEEVDPDRILEGDLLRWLVLCGASQPYLMQVCHENLDSKAFFEPLAQKLYTHLMLCFTAKKPFDFLEFAELADGEELGGFLSEILRRKVNREKAEALLVDTIQRIKERNWMLEREDIKLKIHSGSAGEVEVLELVKRFDELKRLTPKVILPVKETL